MPIDGAYEHIALLLRFTRLIYSLICAANGFLWCAVKEVDQT